MTAIKVGTRNEAANEINISSFTSHLWGHKILDLSTELIR